jgi:hypothetical protein
MKVWRQDRYRLSLFVLTLILMVPTIEAIDPLPPHIEAASEEVRNAYIERLAQDSLKEKLEVGKERYDSRMQFKSETVQHMRSEAEERIKIIRADRESIENSEIQQSSGSGNTFIYFMCAILLAGMLYFRNRANSRVS